MTNLDLRQALNGMLHRLRHGAEWSEIESWGHAEAIRQRQGVWFRSGAWQALMEYLTTDGRGTVAYHHPMIPLLHVVGEIRSGVLTLLGAAADDLTELTDGGSGNPISGMFRELAIDAQKIVKAIAGNGDRKAFPLSMT
ncbi:transposase [Streptomyces sp. SA15]|uniref:transposase n=1 Tax=Streptomyces sp. SA15 TaxID=934019 RepID=UPI0015CA7FD5|nr:transposase [Streptomyces sp. SA15]